MTDWNPQQYLKFKNERNRPIYDLILRIEIERPERILDIGCGPGNSTRALMDRWPQSEIIGLDVSRSMIERAAIDHPEIKFVVRDANEDLSDLGHFDLVFANASLQWMPNHETLIPRLFDLLHSKGVLAAQIPQFDRMPISHVLREIERLPEWTEFFKNFKSGFEFYPDAMYYDLLCGPATDIDIWATEYYHIMPTHETILDMIASTGLRPYLDRLPTDKVPEFKNAVLERIKVEYPTRCDGKVLFPFKRLFLVASRR